MDENISYLICSACGEYKPSSEFYPSRSVPRGYQYKCRACVTAYKQSPEGRKASADYRASHPQKGRSEAQKRYDDKNRDRLLLKRREHMRLARKERAEEFHKRDREKALLKNYGITVDEYNRIFEEQGGVCATCGKPEKSKHGYLCVDHDHKTGKVRGLLCHRCNAALGQVYDNVSILRKLIEYLVG